MARTVQSEILRRKRGEEGEQRGRRGGETGDSSYTVGRGEDNLVGMGLEENEGEVMINNSGDEMEMGRGKRKKRESNPFQFQRNHTLFSQSSAKYKEKNIAIGQNRAKQATFKRKRHFSDLKEQVLSLKSDVKRLTAQVKAKTKKIKTLQSKK